MVRLMDEDGGNGDQVRSCDGDNDTRRWLVSFLRRDGKAEPTHYLPNLTPEISKPELVTTWLLMIGC
jgi:hypothetical protein